MAPPGHPLPQALYRFHCACDVVALPGLAGRSAVDLLHIDIHGAGGDYGAGNPGAMQTLVKRVLMGTRGHAVEGRLFDLFTKAA